MKQAARFIRKGAIPIAKESTTIFFFNRKIPLPGLGLHDKYGKEDRRNFQLQEIPMMAAVEYNKSETEKEGYNAVSYTHLDVYKRQR